MATSAVQIEANRANARLSTGPRTEEGKSASSRNATSSGLTGLKIFVRPEEQHEFDAMSANLLDELRPAGETQSHHFDLILHAQWNIRRCLELEAQIQNEAISKGLADALLDEDLSKRLDRIYRYKKMHESSHRRASGELRHLQTESVWRQENGQSLDVESILVDTGKVTIKRQHSSALEQRTNLDIFRRHIEAFTAPPELKGHGRL